MYELNKIETKIHKYYADMLDKTLENVNNDSDIQFNDSTILEALADIWNYDDDREHIGAVLHKIENIREENKGTEVISKSFRIQDDEYNMIVRLKQSLNKYNHGNNTIKISDVIEYLIQQYSLDVELELSDSKNISEDEAEEILKEIRRNT